MSKLFQTSLFALSSLPMVLAAQPAEPTDTTSQQLFEIKNTCIVRFDNEMSKFDVEGRARGMIAAANAQAKHIYQHSIKGFAVNMNCDKAKAAFAEQPNVTSFESDSLVVINPGPPAKKPRGGGGSETPKPEIIPWGVTKVGGPVDSTTSSFSAWILDTGIDLNHADLNVDIARCKSVFTTRKDNTCDDGHGHGTHVAGTIAAIDNDIDVVGVASGATVVPVKVLDRRGSGSNSGVIAGIDYVAKNASPGDCANLSLGGSFSQGLNDAVVAASANGVYFAIAAGNESQDANGVSPASANGANVFTISAIDAANNFATFSNFGNPPIDFSAPGVNIESLNKGGGTTIKSGTSMAAPHACAILMLTSGKPNSSGNANLDPDNTDDPIIHY
jgi:subtilisin family serine protease